MTHNGRKIIDCPLQTQSGTSGAVVCVNIRRHTVNYKHRAVNAQRVWEWWVMQIVRSFMPDAQAVIALAVRET